MRGQRGAGDEFMYWIHQNQHNADVCERVHINEHSGRGFKEFPEDAALSGFHQDDRMYVAVAVNSQKHPEILNAVDSDWRDYEAALQNHGVKITQLCPQCI